MKIFTTILFLILLYSNTYCQRQADSLSSDLRNKITNIDAYVNEIDKDQKLFPRRIPVPEYGIYSNTLYQTNGQPPLKTLKEVRITQNVKTTYYKDGRVVYITEISSAHDNYSNIKKAYFQNDSMIYSTTKLYEEQILQIQCSYNGAEQGGSYTLTITKDSIKYEYAEGIRKFETQNSLSAWNMLRDSFNLTNFDKIQTTSFRSYIDGHDLSYVITTDKRTHSFVNAPFNDPQLKKMTEFFKLVDLLIPLKKN